MPMPLKSMSSIRNPTEGFGAPSYCSTLTDTANLKVTRPRRSARPVQIRHGGEHVFEVLPAGVAQALFIEHGDADGRFDERLLPQRRGDGHLFDDVSAPRNRRSAQDEPEIEGDSSHLQILLS